MFMLNLRDLKAKDTPLPADFQPGEFDVICSRGKVAMNHVGNRIHFQETINNHVERYLQAKTRNERSLMIIEVVDLVRSRSPSGGFVKFCDKQNCYVEVGDARAREKVGHSLRQAINSNKNQEKQKPGRIFVGVKSNNKSWSETIEAAFASNAATPTEVAAIAPSIPATRDNTDNAPSQSTGGFLGMFRSSLSFTRRTTTEDLINAPILDSTEFLKSPEDQDFGLAATEFLQMPPEEIQSPPYDMRNTQDLDLGLEHLLFDAVAGDAGQESEQQQEGQAKHS